MGIGPQTEVDFIEEGENANLPLPDFYIMDLGDDSQRLENELRAERAEKEPARAENERLAELLKTRESPRKKKGRIENDCRSEKLYATNEVSASVEINCN